MTPPSCGAGNFSEFLCNNGFMTLESLILNDFSGGINLVDDPLDLDPNEMASGTHDLELMGKGSSFRLRRGNAIRSSGGTFAALTGVGDHLSSMMAFRTTGNSVDKLIMSNDFGNVYTWDPPTLTANWIIVGPGGTGHLYSFAQSSNSSNVQHAWLSNGVDTPQKYNMVTGVVSAWGGTPPNGKATCVWKNMMVVANVSAQPQRVYYSAIANPESWPANNFIDIKSTSAEDDTIIALEVVGENLLVFKKKSVWVIFDPVSFDNRRIADVGIVNQFAHCVVGDRVWWCANNGIYSTDGDSEPHLESIKISTWIGDASLGTVSMKDCRMASLPDGRVFWFPGPATLGLWCAYSDTTRPDGQHPWMYHSSKFLANILGMCAAQIDDPAVGPVSLAAMLRDPAHSEQDLFQCFYKDSANDDTWYSVVSSALTGVYLGPRLPLVGLGMLERLRRVNFWGTGTFTASFVDTNGTSVWSSSVTPDNATVGKMGFGRARPELRERNHQLSLSFSATTTVSGDHRKIVQVELEYRGGTEH